MNRYTLFSAITFFTLSVAMAIAQYVAQEDSDFSPTQATPIKEDRLTIEMKDQGTPAMKDLKIEREYRPRLPNGYGPAGAGVDAAQREQIYKILTDYNEVIALLELRIELLKKERDAKIEGVLTPAQRERIPRPAAVPNSPAPNSPER